MANINKSEKSVKSTKKSVKPAVAKKTRAKKAVASAAPTTPRTRRAKAAPAVITGPKAYPFTSKREITKRVDENAGEAVSALVTLHQLGAAMCSQKKLVSDLAARVAEAGEGATNDEALVGACRAVARRYGRRLALQARAVQLASQPDLAPLATLFSANV